MSLASVPQSLDYPSAERQDCGYAIRYLKWLCDSGVASEVGPDAVAVVTAVVTQEDDIFYSRAPNFYNEQLMRRSGIGSEPALIRARRRAIDSGILVYEPGAKRRPGRYFTSGFTNDSLAKDQGRTNDSLAKAQGKRRENGALHTLTLTPTQKEARSFSKPSLEEVRAYCRERKNTVDPERFIDHYTANGWRQAGGPLIRDWKAAVRNWERNKFNPPAKSEPEQPRRKFGT